MTDETQLESSQPGDEGELPTPSFSSEGVSSTSSGADVSVSNLRSALLEELKPLIQQTIEKQVQSTKDKRIAKIEGRLGLLADLEEQGATIPENVKQEMRFRDLEERLTQPTQPAPPVDAGTSQKAAVTEAIAELSKYGLSPNDPAFIELLRGNYPSKDAFDAKVQRHIVGKLAPPPPASPAGIVQAPVTKGAQPADLQREFDVKAKGLRSIDLINLKMEYRRKGLDIS